MTRIVRDEHGARRERVHANHHIQLTYRLARRASAVHAHRPRYDCDDDTIVGAARPTSSKIATTTAAITDAKERKLSAPLYGKFVLSFTRRFPHAGYSARFRVWTRAERPRPYNRWGNGSAMRVSAIGFAFHSMG